MPHSAAAAPGIQGTLRGIGWASVLSALIVISADWLFYREPVGISVVVFASLLALAAAIANPLRASMRARLAATGVLVMSLLPIVGLASPLSLLSGIVGISIFTLMLTGTFSGNAVARLGEIFRLLFGGPLRLCVDLDTVRRAGRRSKLPIVGRAALAKWVIPILLGAVFLLLFRSANPVIEHWLADLDFIQMLDAIDRARLLFWVVAAGLTWSFLRVRPHHQSKWWTEATRDLADNTAEEVAQYFGDDTVLYSLILFNALFAVQTALDLAYLWGGAELPEGMTYSAYARRGAYPLVVTALLAGAFVLVGLRPGSPAEASPINRSLVYLWIGQNVLLMISALQRLNLYVQAYSLTYLRIAAFVWMFLVAAGLILIVTRIAARRSNAWLVKANIVVLAATLYICAFVNFPHLVASYNIAHSKLFSAEGISLDQRYICQLGPYAIPEMDKLFAAEWRTSGSAENKPTVSRLSSSTVDLKYCAPRLAWQHQERMANWRAWSYRGWKLLQYLAKSGPDRSSGS